MERWQQWASGAQCPLCGLRAAPDESLYPVRRLSVSTLYLTRDQTYEGACRVIYDEGHVNRLDELSAAQWQRLARDLWLAARALAQGLAFDHMNVASLGNEVPHLHWHLIPRRRADGRWGAPIWSHPPLPATPRVWPAAHYQQLSALLNAHIEALLNARETD